MNMLLFGGHWCFTYTSCSDFTHFFLSLQWSYPDFMFDMRNYLFYSQAAGLAAGFLLGSILSDHLGRRRVIWMAFTLTCTVHCASIVSPSWLVFVVGQGLVCCGAGKFSYCPVTS